MDKRTILVSAVPALLCGALLGYFIHPATPAPQAPDGKVEQPAKKKTARPVSDDAALNRLRKRIQDLERQLAEKNAAPEKKEKVVETPPPPSQPAAQGEHRGPPTPEEMRAHMEEIRKNDPERYTRMTNHFANMRTHQLERAQNKLDILASVDVSRLNPKQRQIHEQYQDLIAQQEEIRNTAFAPDDGSVTDEQRRTAHQQMREIGQKLHNVAQQEREILLNQTARSFGVKGEAGKELVETVKAVYQATESWGGFGRGRGGRGGRH